MANTTGILLMVLSMAAFAIEDAFIKTAAETLPTGQILLVVGLAGGMIFAAIARAQGLRLLSPLLLSPPVLVRNLSEIAGTLGFISAITLIPLSTASAIAQAMPLFITLGAAVVFREPVGWRRWSAIALGFTGVLVIIRPGLDGFDPNALWAVLAVVGLGTRDLASRAVPKSVPHMQLAAYGFLAIVPTALILLPVTGGVMPMEGREMRLLAGAVLFGVLGYYTIVSASRTGDVSVVTPFRYTRLLFALTLGALFFGERPDALTLAGAALIVGSGLYTVLRERRLKRVRAAPQPRL